MKKLDINEIRQLQLQILDKVVSVCNNNNIKYFLCGGTLLGAIRHNGYIPWDDDIDIMMPREDYKRFLATFEHKDYLLHSNYECSYPFPYVKVSLKGTYLFEHTSIKYNIGVNIDIFPIDGIPSYEKQIKSHINTITLYKKMLIFKYLNVNSDSSLIVRIIHRLIKILLAPIRLSYLVNKIDKLAQKYEFSNCENAGITVWGYGVKECCRRDVYSKSTEVLFEGKMYNSPFDFNTYLSNVYGDYMKLPPENKRLSNHFFEVFTE